jgi:hypothetical protein
LEESGLISGYHAHLDRHRAGWGVLGFVQLGLHNHTAEVTAAFEREVQALPQVLACHNLSGRYDYQLEVVAPSRRCLPNSCAPASAACRECANFHQLFAQGSQAHGGAAGMGQRPKRRGRGGQALKPGQGCASSDGRISCALENSRNVTDTGSLSKWWVMACALERGTTSSCTPWLTHSLRPWRRRPWPPGPHLRQQPPMPDDAAQHQLGPREQHGQCHGAALAASRPPPCARAVCLFAGRGLNGLGDELAAGGLLRFVDAARATGLQGKVEPQTNPAPCGAVRAG